MGSVYRYIDVVGTDSESWEAAATNAINTAAGSLRDMRIAEVVNQDITITEDGKPDQFRVKLSLSFKYEQD